MGTSSLRVLGIASLALSLACAACSPSRGVQQAARVESAAPVAKSAGAPPVAQAASSCERAMANEPLSTPDAAVNRYVESIAAGDVGCALHAYAAHEEAAAFDFETMVDYVQVLSPAAIKMPAQYPMFVELNELRVQGEMADATKAFVYGLLTDVDPGGVETMDSEAKARSFLSAVNPARLAKLKVVRIDEPGRLAADGPKAHALFERFARLDGAHEVTERIALYELGGQLFWSGFRLGRYDKTWKITRLESTYGGPIGRVVSKTDVAEYDGKRAARQQPGRVETSAREAKPAATAPSRRVAIAFPATPEAAVRAYVESIARRDLTGALQTYAAHEYAARFDFTASVTYTYQFGPALMRAPAEYPMFVELNELRAKASLAEGTKRFVYGLLADRDPLGSHKVTSDADTRAFVQAVDPARLATLKLVRVDAPRGSATNDPALVAIRNKSPASKEAEETAERIALYELSGQLFGSAFELRRYDKAWKIYEFGAPSKTTAAEYQARIQ